MNYPLYEYSLCIALPLMIFFGVYFLLAPTPDRAIFANYLRSRRIMGVAILLLAANYAVHFFFGIRFHNVNAAILMNLSTYFLCYWLFSSALTTLLDRFYVTGRRFAFHLAAWMLFTLLSAFILLGLHGGPTQKAGLTVMAAWLVCYGIWLARRLIRAYRRAVRLFADTHSDDIGAYIRWLSIFTYWAVIFGVGCGLLTFLPDRYVFVWILSSVPFYIYLFHCYQSYLLFYERVEHAMESEIASEDEILSDAGTEPEPEPEMPITGPRLIVPAKYASSKGVRPRFCRLLFKSGTLEISQQFGHGAFDRWHSPFRCTDHTAVLTSRKRHFTVSGIFRSFVLRKNIGGLCESAERQARKRQDIERLGPGPPR